ncbi:hypothetical protein [Saezia sanguinis]|uniref:hypothetical protein n=1 Tax=Saezia sanguinis TaxID=1965230 RepID=UPI00306FA375
MKKILLICTIFLLSLMPLAYAQQTTPITKDEAVEIAKQELINQGSLGDWSDIKISAYFIDSQWWVRFSPKPNSEGLVPIGAWNIVLISSDGQEKEIVRGF